MENFQITLKTSNISQSFHRHEVTIVTLYQGVPIHPLNTEVRVWIHLLEKPAQDHKFE